MIEKNPKGHFSSSELEYFTRLMIFLQLITEPPKLIEPSLFDSFPSLDEDTTDEQRAFSHTLGNFDDDFAVTLQTIMNVYNENKILRERLVETDIELAMQRERLSDLQLQYAHLNDKYKKSRRNRSSRSRLNSDGQTLKRSSSFDLSDLNRGTKS